MSLVLRFLHSEVSCLHLHSFLHCLLKLINWSLVLDIWSLYISHGREWCGQWSFSYSGLTPGPECLKDLVKKVGWRLKVYKAIRELYEGENVSLSYGLWVHNNFIMHWYRKKKVPSQAWPQSAVTLVSSVIGFVIDMLYSICLATAIFYLRPRLVHWQVEGSDYTQIDMYAHTQLQ